MAEMDTSKQVMMAVESKPRHDAFTLLPSEIRGKIFNNLEQSDVCKLRLVCKQWDEDIMDSYNFSITLNEDSPGLRFLLQLRIAKLEVKKLVQKRMRILPVEGADSDSDSEGCQLRSGKVLQQQKLTFKRPNSIRQIIIDEESKLSPKDVMDLLQRFKKTLSCLEFSKVGKKMQMSRRRFPAPLSFEFQNLKRLDLTLDFDTYDCQNNCLQTLLETSQFPSLSTLKIVFYDAHNTARASSAVGLLLKLLTMNPKGMEELSYSSHIFSPQHANVLNERKLSAPELASLKTVTDFKRMDLHGIILPASTSPQNFALLFELISRQRKLETIDMDFEFSSILLKSIVLNNSETIVEIHIHDLNVSSEDPFDISVLKNCHQLQRFSLEKFKRISHEDDLHPELINCDSFPGGLIKLSLRDFRILSRDLLEIVQSDLLLTLEELSLINCGDSGNCGVNLSVLVKIVGLLLRKEKLESIRLKQFNTSGPWKELMELKMRRIMKQLWDIWDLESLIWLVRDDDNPNPDISLVNLRILCDRWREEGFFDERREQFEDRFKEDIHQDEIADH